MEPWEVEKIDFKNDSNLNKIRNQWNSNQWPTECFPCKIAEENGNTSRRNGSIEWSLSNNTQQLSSTANLLKIDFWVGNVCNLKCAICGPNNSILWQKELGIAKNNRIIEVTQLHSDVNLNDIKWIHFTGGEPLLEKSHYELLESIENKSQVIVNYNTNATVLPDTQLINIWKKFKNVILDFSIDDIEERFEYQRFPARWNNVVKNMFWYRDNMPVNVMFEINTSIGILNFKNYHNIQKWFQENFSTNRVTDPVRLRTQPTTGILSLDIEEKTKVKCYLDNLDEKRKTNWKQTFPEIVNIILN